MRAVQIVIKAFALCLAGGIIFAMFAAVVGLVAWTGLITGGDFAEGPTTTIWQEEAQARVTQLKIGIGATNLRITQDEDAREVRVESNNEHVTSWNDGDTLQVVEKNHAFWEFQGHREVVIYVPMGYKFDEVIISAGAGTVSVDYLVAKRVKLELGAGRTEISQIEATEFADIEGGAGLIELKKGKLKNLDLEVGAGKAEITAELQGDSKIKSGVGRLELDLSKTAGDYRFVVDKGIGAVTIDGVSQGDDATYGSGNNLVKLEAGVGSVEVKTAK